MYRFFIVILVIGIWSCKGNNRISNPKEDAAGFVSADSDTVNRRAPESNCDDIVKGLRSQSIYPDSLLIAQLKDEKLSFTKDVKNISADIMNLLHCITDHKYTIANPGESWQNSCTRYNKLPDRQLISIAQNAHWFIMNYRTGGFTTTTHIILIKHTGNQVELFQSSTGFGKSLSDKEAFLNYLKGHKKETTLLI